MSAEMIKKRASKDTLPRLLSYVKPYRLLLAASIICAAASVICTLYAPLLIGDAVDCIIDKGNVSFKALKEVLIKLGVVAGLAALFQWIMTVLTNKISYSVIRQMRNDCFEKLEHLPLSFIDRTPHGDVVSRIISDAEAVCDGLLLGFSQFFTGIVTIIATIVFMLTINVKITLVVVIATPLSLFVARFLSKRTFNLFKSQSVVRGEMTGYVNEMLGGIKTVTAFSQEDESCEHFDDINKRYENVGVKALFFSSLVNPSTRFVNNLVYTAVGIVGAFSAIATGGITVGQLSCFLSYANQYTKPFNEISGVITELQSAMASADRLFSVMDEMEQTPDKPDAKELQSVDGSVDAVNVSFSYNPDVKLIENFNLSVDKGQRVAIVGPTGCGKTTVINLLMRFYDCDKGEIRVSEIPINDIKRSSLRGAYGMVLQETWLKTATVWENIAYGCPEATQDEIVAAAKAAHCHSFIKRLPNGYNTVLSDDGILSQGEKQLLCIARVMLRLPPMLILDEATSSIDTRTEQRIQRAFAKMMQGRTSFIVAHRLSTIREADVILVMKNGNIIEQGTHEELLQKGGFYSELYNSQFAVS